MAISAFELFLVSIVHSIRQLFVSLGKKLVHRQF